MRSQVSFTSLALLLAVLLIVPAGSAAIVTLGSGEIDAVGGETTVYLVLDRASGGLSGYNIDLTLGNPSVAEITNISFPSWAADMHASSPYPTGSKTLIKASDVNNRIGDNAADVVLAAVTIRGLSAGTSTISLSGQNFDNEAGTDIPVTLVHSLIAVNTSSGRLPFDAQLAGHTIPSSLPNNRNISVAITVNNTGIRPWMEPGSGTSGVWLAAVNGSGGDAAKFGFSRMDIPENTAILTGREHTFTFVMQVPNETGSYTPAYRLESETTGPFGLAITVPVTVVQYQPAIVFTAPSDDNYANESVIFNGTVSDATITGLNIRHNGANITSWPVTNGNFSGTVVLNANDVVTASAYDQYGLWEEASLYFDGDRLPSGYEQSIGFDPVNTDSDNILTAASEAGNGIPDGYEKLDGKLPAFVKYRLGADPFVMDTDGDLLTDEFELVRLGLTTNVTTPDSDYDGITDANEDTDSDGLINLVEQQHGTDPLVTDSDGDSLTDPDEIARGTNPTAKDTDNDALDDDSEVRLGTNPLVADSNGNSVPDGNETFVSTKQFFGSSLELSVTGIGDAVKRASVSNVNYTHLIPDTVLVSNVSAITFGNNTASSVVRIHYFPAKVGTPSNLSMFVKNETSGSFDSVPFVLDSPNAVVYSTVTASGEYAVMDRNLWNARFTGGAEPEQMAMMGMAAPVTMTKTGASGKKVSTYVYVDSLVNRTLLSSTGHGIKSKTSSSTGKSSKKLADGQSALSETYLMSGSGSYEAVLNGDFSNGMAFWTPNGPDSISSSESAYYQVTPDYSNYYSSPSSLKMHLHLRPPSGSAINYDISHSDIYLSGASTLSYKYRCSEFQQANSNTGAHMTVSLYNSAGTRVAYKSYTFTGTTPWTTDSFSVAGYTGAYRIVFSPYLSGYPSSRVYHDYMTINVDDVSATSDTPPSPSTVNIRFCLFTSSGAPYTSMGSVTSNDGSGIVKPLKKSGCTDAFSFTGGGARQFQVETQDYPTKYLDSTILSGEQGTINVNVDGGAQQTAALLNVVSNPTGASIFINGANYGTTPLSGASVSTSGSPAITARLTGYKDLTTLTFPKNPGNYDVPLNLEVATGEVRISSTPSGAIARIGDLNLGETPAIATNLPVGTYTVTVSKQYYADYTTQVTVVQDQIQFVDVVLGETNSDTDQLSDIREVQGYLDPFGNTRTSDPTIADTDTDGLPDDYEAGYLTTTLSGKSVWKVRSNPQLKDSDKDGLDDYTELKIVGSKALDPDSDHDRLPDGAEWLVTETDLWSDDSDGDDATDYDEVYDGNLFTDPIVYEQRETPSGILAEIQAGYNNEPSPSGKPDSSYYRYGILADGGSFRTASVKSFTNVYINLRIWNSNLPYKKETDTFNEFLEMGLMVQPETRVADVPILAKSLVKEVDDAPLFFDDATRLAKEFMSPAEADAAVLEIENVVKVPTTDIARTRGFANWKEGEKWLKVLVGGTEDTTHYGILTDDGWRYIDQFVGGTAHEMKTGRVYASKEIKTQVDKDIWLLKNGKVSKVEWHFGKSMQSGRSGYSQGFENYVREAVENAGLTFGTDFKLTNV